jgi:hypothetical protein
VTAIAAGGFHACALTSDGGVKCWGDNLYGQLGDGSTDDRSTPGDVVGLSNGVTAISLGWSHTCALSESGTVKCWGNNPFGGLGNNATADSPVPVEVAGLAGGVRQIAAGGGHTCALTGVGGVKCWGDGQSDDPALFHTSVPVDVPGLVSGVAAITAGQDRTCALMAAGGVTCWGPNYAPPPGETLPDRFVPLDVAGFPGGIAAIVAGVEDTNLCALTRGAGVACGLPSRGLAVVPGLAGGVDAIAVGGTHACALIAGGAVTCWGSNTHGQLGTVLRCSSSSIPVDVRLDGTVGPVPTPEPLQLPAGRLEHATGATDVLFRFDLGPDFAVGDLVGELFQPGPEFTLYGDGTVIFRDATSSGPPPSSRIVRVRPFMVAQLDEDEVQAFLRFALDEGGLWDACERYESQDIDVSSWFTLTVHAAGIDKRVENAFPAQVDDYVSTFGTAHPTAAFWVADRYWGNLLDTSVFQYIGDGVTPGLAESGSVGWPWPALAPSDFVGRNEGGWTGTPRRVMTAEEASVLGLSDNGGVVQRVYLRGPDGKTIYYFSLWPMSPDERG